MGVVLWNVNEGNAAAVVTKNVVEKTVAAGVVMVVVVVDCEVNEPNAVDTVVSVT